MGWRLFQRMPADPFVVPEKASQGARIHGPWRMALAQH